MTCYHRGMTTQESEIVRTATLVAEREIPREGFTAALRRTYRVNPPLPYTCTLSDAKLTTEYLAVSAADVTGSGPETYIFPADEDGEVLDWLELEGSYKGGLDHERALRGAGYVIVEESE